MIAQAAQGKKCAEPGDHQRRAEYGWEVDEDVAPADPWRQQGARGFEGIHERLVGEGYRPAGRGETSADSSNIDCRHAEQREDNP